MQDENSLLMLQIQQVTHAVVSMLFKLYIYIYMNIYSVILHPEYFYCLIYIYIYMHAANIFRSISFVCVCVLSNFVDVIFTCNSEVCCCNSCPFSWHCSVTL